MLIRTLISLWLLSLPVTASPWLLDLTAPSQNPASGQLRLVLHTVEEQNQGLALRIGFQNISAQPSEAFGILEPSDFRLVSQKGVTSPEDVPPNFWTLSPPEGIAPGQANTGDVVFPVTALQKKFRLHVKHFEPLEFTLTPNKTFTVPIPGKSLLSRPVTLQHLHENLGVIPLTIEQISLDKEMLHIHLKFQNTSRHDLNFASKLSGVDAAVLTADFKKLKPSTISDTLKSSIAPPGDVWKAGSVNRGTVSFRFDSFQALRQLHFGFFGYQNLTFRYDGGTRTLVPNGAKPAARSIVKAKEARSINLNEEIAFVELTAWAMTQTDLLETGVAAEFFAPILKTGNIPVHRQALTLPKNQVISLMNGGEKAEALIIYEYQIKGLSNQIMESVFRATFQKTDQWECTSLVAHKRPPFWTLGYKQLALSDHFILVVRPGTSSEKKVKKSLSQLEKAYKTLGKEGLPLEPRYLSIFAESKLDFQKITGESTPQANGLATFRRHDPTDAPSEVRNLMMVINDGVFLDEKRVFGVQDRQKTITHELVHLALAPMVNDASPLWLTEGSAVHFANQNDSWAVQSLVDSRAMATLYLTNLCDINRLPNTYAYVYCGETVAHLIKTHGLETFFQFLRSFSQLKDADVAAKKREFPNSYRTQFADKLVNRRYRGTLRTLDKLTKQAVSKKSL